MYCTVYKISQADTKYCKIQCILYFVTTKAESAINSLHVWKLHPEQLSCSEIIGNLKLLSVDIVTYYKAGFPTLFPQKQNSLV